MVVANILVVVATNSIDKWAVEVVVVAEEEMEAQLLDSDCFPLFLKKSSYQLDFMDSIN